MRSARTDAQGIARFADVAAPPESRDAPDCACEASGPDGLEDLVVRFRSKAVLAALGAKVVILAALLSTLAVLGMSRLLTWAGPVRTVSAILAVSAALFAVEWWLYARSAGVTASTAA